MKNNDSHQSNLRIAALLSLFMILVLLISGIASANPTADSYAYLPILMKPYTTFTLIPSTARFDNATDIVNAGDDRLFIGQREGIIKVMQPNEDTSIFLDIRDRVTDSGSEQGFFSIAFHPDYATNGYFFVSYTAPTDSGSNGRLTVSRFQVSADPNIANPASETIVFTLSQVSPIHNGGGLRFHPNGNLYLGVGDDSNSDAAQSSGDVKGKILHLDINGLTTTNLVNTFNAEASVPTYIVAKGLRNPWRIGIDPNSGEVYIGDVGDRSYEEINIMNVGWDGWNFGWPCYEGPSKELDCGNTDFQEPIFYYSHGVDQPFTGCVVTAGEMNINKTSFTDTAQFIFADACRRDIYAIFRQNGNWEVEHLGTLEGLNGLLTAFGVDVDGNIFVSTLENDTPIHKLIIP